MHSISVLPNYVQSDSPYGLIWPLQRAAVHYLPITRAAWSSKGGELWLHPESPIDHSFLSSLNAADKDIVVAYKHYVAVCDIRENVFLAEREQSQFRLQFLITRSDFIPPFELALGGTSADRLAELRAKRLLLNQFLAEPSHDINSVTNELFLAGQGTLVKVEKSPFPDLYKHFGNDQKRFLEIAWIAAAAQLKLSACVAEISTLSLSLADDRLHVIFSGKRRHQVRNRAPFEISFNGYCSLNS